MRRYWAHDPRFTPENFGFQPIWLILQALEFGAKFQCEELHLQELGIATLSALFANANRDPKKGSPARAQDFFYFKQEGRDIRIPGIACETFFSLIADGLLPGWALGIAPIDRLRECRKGSRVGKPRAWMSEDLVLILPKIEGDRVTAALCFSNGARGFTVVTDPDVGAEFCLELPESGQVLWALESEFARADTHDFSG